MPVQKITDLFAERVKAPTTGRVEFFDASFPGLCLRVTDNGVKSWCLFYRLHGRQRRLTLGKHPVIKPAQARREAQRALEHVREGIDPADLKRSRRDTRVVTFGDLVTEYLERHARVNTRPSTFAQTRDDFARNILPRWQKRPIASITKGDVIALVDSIVDRGAAVMANRTLGRLKTFYKWAVAKDLVAVSPTATVEEPTNEEARDRVLSDDEIRWLWRACESVGWPFGPIGQLLLVTAQRRGEVAELAWTELDLDAAQWTIPRNRAKSDREHLVALSSLALGVLRPLPHYCDLVFAREPGRPPSSYSTAKHRIDEAMLEAKRADVGNADPIPNWTFHDLRRTATTGMARLRVPPHIADRVLNHTAGTIKGVAKTYNRFEYLDERRQALEAWGRFVEGLILPES
jgi:integrase